MVKTVISIVKIVDDSSFPGYVECVLYDAWNGRHIFVDKIPIFTCQTINSESIFPKNGFIRFEIVKKWVDDTGREIVTVSTQNPDYLETVNGITEFDLLESQISSCA